MHKLRNLTAAFVALCLLTGALAGFAAEAAGKVNLNQATLEQLSYLPRVGPALALRIVDFRKENGPFKNVEDLMLVRGIGDKTFALMRPYLTLEGETSLSQKVRTSRPTGDEPAGDQSSQ